MKYLEMFNGIRTGKMIYFSPLGYSLLIVLAEILILVGLIISSKKKLFDDPLTRWFIDDEK